MNTTFDNNSLDPEPKIFSVSEINRLVRDVLMNNFTTIWIKGEISGFRQFSSGTGILILRMKDLKLAAQCGVVKIIK